MDDYVVKGGGKGRFEPFCFNKLSIGDARNMVDYAKRRGYPKAQISEETTKNGTRYAAVHLFGF